MPDVFVGLVVVKLFALLDVDVDADEKSDEVGKDAVGAKDEAGKGEEGEVGEEGEGKADADAARANNASEEPVRREAAVAWAATLCCVDADVEYDWSIRIGG
jgi:hypothetical protein